MEFKENQVYEILLEHIVPSETLIREIDGATLNDLKESIRQFGVLQPILIRPLETDNKFEIVFGNHRFYAVKLLGLKTIPAQIKKIGSVDSLLFGITENIQRLSMDAVREGELYSKILEETNIKFLSEKLGKSVRYIQGRISLYQNLNPDLKKELGNKLTIQCAIRLSSLPNEAQKIVFEEIEKNREMLESRYKPPRYGSGDGWGDYDPNKCTCPKCGSKHIKGVNSA